MILSNNGSGISKCKISFWVRTSWVLHKRNSRDLAVPELDIFQYNISDGIILTVCVSVTIYSCDSQYMHGALDDCAENRYELLRVKDLIPLVTGLSLTTC